MKIHVPGRGWLFPESVHNFWASEVVTLDLFVSAAGLCVCVCALHLMIENH